MGKSSRVAAVLLAVAMAAGPGVAGASAAGVAPAGAVGVRPDAAGHLGAPCPWKSPDLFRWVGPATGSWDVAANWSRAAVPGTVAGNHDFVCVPADVTVGIKARETFDVRAVWVRGALTLVDGGALYVHGNQSTEASAVQSVTLDGGVLGGEGLVTVYGDLVMSSSAAFTATLTTRHVEVPVTAPPPQPGRLALAIGSQLTITSPYRSCSTLCGGVRLRDEYVLDSDSNITLAGTGFLLANWGTKILNGLSGFVNIQNNFGIYQGARPPWATTRAILDNQGLIQRSIGAGTSVVDVHYVDDGGIVATQAGTLSIFSDGFPASVEDGTAVADGGCPDGQAVCRVPTPVPALPQLNQLVNQTGTLAGLTLKRLAPLTSDPFGQFYRLKGVSPLTVAISGAPSADAPVRILISLDLSVVPTKDSNGNPIVDPIKFSELKVGLGSGAIPPCLVKGVANPSVCLDTRTLNGSVVTITVLRAKPGKTTLIPMGPRFR